MQLTEVSKQSDEGIYEIEITTDNIALFVWLDTNKIKGRFSENGFLQVTGKRNIYFYSEEETTADDLLKDLTITNLLDEEYLK